MKNLARAYFDEAEWLAQGYTPTMEDYLHVSLVSSCYPMLTVAGLLGTGDIATEDIFKWAFNDPNIVRASATIGRFTIDIISHKAYIDEKFEQERGHVASSVECYMKQYILSEEEACEELNKHDVKAWKDINSELLKPHVAPKPVLIRVLKLSRVIDLFYKDGDDYTHVGKWTKEVVAALLIDSIQ